MLAHQVMRVQREGDWILPQHCLEWMLPYFFIDGHHHYARYISWHLRDMQHIPLDAKQDLLGGSHVCCHTDEADVYQTDVYIKQGETSRGLEGTSTNPEQVAVFVLTLQFQWTKKAAKDGTIPIW